MDLVKAWQYVEEDGTRRQFAPKTRPDCIESEDGKTLSELFGNPNLLINGSFRNPVNQRGKTTYNQAGYTVDRWRMGQKCSLTLNSGYVRMTADGSWSFLEQRVEQASRYAGKTLTLSVRARPAVDLFLCVRVLRSGEYLLNSNRRTVPDAKFNTYVLTADIPNGILDTDLFIVQLSNITDKGSIDFEYIKLEEGSFATSNPIRTCAQELLLCQRYYWNSAAVYRSYVTGSGNNDTALNISFPVTMRAKPSVTYDTIEGTTPPHISSNSPDGLSFAASNWFTIGNLKADAEIN